MTKGTKPGSKSRAAGKYVEVGVKGRKIRNGKTVNLKAGTSLPPTSSSKNKWKKV